MSLIVPDLYDKLFCRCDNIATPNTFLDDSTANPKTVTRNGNATQLPIKFNKSAGFFDGSSYIDIADSADWAFGKGPFTIEGFFFFSAISSQQLIDSRTVTTNATGFDLYVNTNKLGFNRGTSALISGATVLVPNTWYHVMVVGDGGADGARTIKLYLDGVQEGSTSTVDYNFTDQTLRIGSRYATSASPFNGWMKEVRLSKVARTVAVPTAQYATDANTVLLMHFDTPATSPLGPAIAFDGTGDYLKILNANKGTDFEHGTNPFTYEGVFVFNSTSGAQELFDFGLGGSRGVRLQYNAGAFYLNCMATAVLNYTTTPVIGRPYHIAVVRESTDSNKTHLFINGQKVVSGTSSDNISTGSDDMAIFADISGTQALNGYLREFRVSNVARYTDASNFTPSQTGFTVDANTKLYIKGNEDNGVTTFVDSSTSPKTVTTAGDTKIKYTEDYRSCIFKDETGKFPYPVGSAKVDFFAIGSGVGYFDGTNDYLSIPDHEDWDFGTGTFTAEVYVRWSTVGTASILYRGAKNWGLEYAAGHLYWYAETATINEGTWTPIVNTWYHLAVSRGVANNIMFVNGTVLDTDADSTDIVDTTELRIGVDDSTANDFLGLLDNIRISKGVARYTAAFNPPDDYQAAPSYNKGAFFALL